MSQLPPQTLSIKRKRNDAPVDALRFDASVSIKRQKSSQNFAYRRLTTPNDISAQAAHPAQTAERRFHLDPTGVGAKRVFVEERPTPENKTIATDDSCQAPLSELAPDSTPRSRKRPGAGSALRTSASAIQRVPQISSPSENEIRELEAFSQEISKVDNLRIPLPPSPSKHKPRPPAQRFADRRPNRAAALVNDDPDAMDVDTDDYVIDTFIREPLLSDAPEPTGAIGLLVLKDEDADWWDGDEASDKEFDTDDDDENAEDYYANDYPEDELSEDDEFGRDMYQKKYRRGSDEEEYNLDEADDDNVLGSGEDEDDLHHKMTLPKAQRVGYWGKLGE